MKQFFVRRVLPVLLVVSILIPCLSANAFAAGRGSRDPINVQYDYESATYWDTRFNGLGPQIASAAVSAYAAANGLPAYLDGAGLLWDMIDRTFGYDIGEVSLTRLWSICDRFNSYFDVPAVGSASFGDNLQVLGNLSIAGLVGLQGIHFEVVLEDNLWYRIRETSSGIYVVNSSGAYPYVWSQIEDAETGDHWVHSNEINRQVSAGTFQGILVSWDTLQALSNYHVQNGTIAAPALIPGTGGMYGVNKWKAGEWWCNEDGRPYYAYKDSEVAIEQERPVTDIVPDDGSEPIDPEDNYEVGIDFDGMVIYLPDGTMQIIDEVYYNPTTFTYDVTAYDVTNIDVTYNYTYKYYLQYTYVTYIGETSDFEAYKCYYQLPDGRNSADLTKEELEQLSVAIDVVEYNRSTDDVRVRALYHFDGNTKDSSYWNHMSYFDWSNAPSITYMDVETFNGALYFDGNVRSTMHITLPTDLGRGDFTIQFRYYQGQKVEDDDKTGLYLNADNADNEWSPSTGEGAVKILGFDGDRIVSGSGSKERHPVGSWFEVCITRQGDVFTYYLNGMPLIINDDVFTGESFDDILTFHFNGGTVAYSMIDELRVLNYAIASGDESYYEPTAVPHDTNLALVLPEDKVAIADEYWSFDSSAENLMEHYGLADWTQMSYDPPANLRAFNGRFLRQNGSWVTDPKFNLNNFFDGKVTAWYNSRVVETDLTRSGLSFDLIYEDEEDYEYLSHTGGFAVTNSGVMIPFAGIYIPIGYAGSGCLADGDYVFSVVNGSGAIRSIKFKITNGVAASASSATFGNLRLSISRLFVDGKAVSYLFVGFNPKTDKVPTQPIVYMELIEGTSTDLKAEFHEDVAILDKDDQFKPTLAVRTDLEITDYQIGGVRPAIPSKGLVYALVQSGYITSLQIYNGQAWEAVDGRIWTGERWIPYSSYNIITLQDMYDISDTTNDYEYIYTETGFWSWWQRSWNEFTGKLFGLLGGGAGDVDLDEPVTESDPENEDDLSFWEFIKLLLNGCKAVFTGARQLFGGVVSTVPEAVSTLTGAFEPGGMAVSFLDGADPDADAAELRIVSYTIPYGTYNRGDSLEFSVEATGIGLRYEWYYDDSSSFLKVAYTGKSFTRTASAANGTIRHFYVKCVVTDYKGNQVTIGPSMFSVDATSSPYSLRGFRDVDSDEYYETEVLDPWRYR